MNVSALSKEEFLRLLAAARATREDHWLSILVGYMHALRVSEVVHIKRDDIKDGFLRVIRGKRSEITMQELLTSPNPLLSERSALIELAAFTPPNQPLFNWTRQTQYNVWRRYGAAAGLPAHQCHPHMGKQGCLTHMYEKTKDLPAAQKWGGHRCGSSTLIYIRKNQAQAAVVVKDSLCG
jgi:integrase